MRRAVTVCVLFTSGLAGLGSACSAGGSADKAASSGGSDVGGSGGEGGTVFSGGNGGSSASSSGGNGGTLIGVGGMGAAGSGGDEDNPATCEEAEESKSYIGCEFWPTVTFNPVYENFDFAAVVTNGGVEPAEITVRRDGQTVTTAMVEPGELQALTLPWVMALKGPAFDAQTTGSRVKESVRVDGGAYQLTSSRPVTVWQFNPLQYEKDIGSCPVTPAYGDGSRCLSVTNDAALLLPATAMTGAYRLSGRSAKNGGDTWGSTPGAFTITATRDDTEVQVQLSADLAAGSGVSAASAGDTITLDLDAGDVVQLLGVWGAFWDDPHGDLSGSVVVANNPVQVIASNPLSNVPDENVGFADHIEETVLPGEVLGTSYLVAPPSAPDGNVIGHVVRFYGNVDGTSLSYPAGVTPSGAPTTLDAGAVVELGPLTEAFEVSADQPFAMASFMVGGQSQDPTGSDVETRGDPASSIAISPEQFRRQYTFLAPADYLESYANLLVPDGASVTLDGEALADAGSPIGSSGWNVVRVLLGSGRGGAHRLEADQPVGLQVMGFGHATAYYYPGGLNLKLISEPPVIDIK